MIIVTFIHSWHCEVPENILASVFDDLPVFLVMFNILFDSQVLSYALDSYKTAPQKTN